MINNNIKVFIIATEQSGDNLGSELIKNLKMNSTFTFDFFGIGGDNMIREGLKITNHISEFKSLGFFEIIFSLRKLLSILNTNVLKAVKFKPNLVITIDSPDFSFRFVKKLKNNNIKCKYVHYVAPTVWAWRESRAKYISNLYDLLLSIFPFEKKYFEKYNLKTVFVGNPICSDKPTIVGQKNKLFIGFYPGSRINEIRNLLPYLRILSEHINRIHSQYRIFIPTLPHLKNIVKDLVKNWKIKPIIIDNKIEINQYTYNSQISIVCSGTATLEVLVKKIPIIVIYKLNIWTEILFSFFVKTKFANIINIIENKEIIPELVNHKLTIKKLIKKFDLLINNKKLQNMQINESQKFIKSLCLKKNNSYNASIEILKII